MAQPGSQSRSTDPFWDKVIVAAATVATYPTQEIDVEVKDQHANVWCSYEEDTLVVNIKTWVKGVDENA